MRPFCARAILAGLVACLLNISSYADVYDVDYLDGDTQTIGQVEFSPCRVFANQGRFRKNAWCAKWAVPENYAASEGRMLSLFIVRFPSTSDKPVNDALTLLAGGPGAAASESYLNADQLFSTLRQQRDIYLIDQRGTGRSNKLACPELTEQQTWDGFDYQRVVAATQQCLESLDVDVRQYTTAVAVRDLDQVRQALGLTQWNIYGASYGSRVALEYLRQFPEQTRSVVIDGVVPPTQHLGPDIALESQKAIDALVERCRQDLACNEAFPQLSHQLQALWNRFSDGPVNVSYEDFTSGEIEEMAFSREHLAGLIRLALYQDASIATLPLLIHKASADGHFAPLARQAQMLTQNMGHAISLGMHNSVVCTEDFPFYQKDTINSSALEKTYIGPVLLDSIYATCEVWPKGQTTPTLKTPLRSDKPVLLLSGSADPITPPSYAEEVAQYLTNKKHIVNTDAGHGQIAQGCIPTIMTRFIMQADVHDLDEGCLARFKASPFFINFNGPKP